MIEWKSHMSIERKLDVTEKKQKDLQKFHEQLAVIRSGWEHNNQKQFSSHLQSASLIITPDLSKGKNFLNKKNLQQYNGFSNEIFSTEPETKSMQGESSSLEKSKEFVPRLVI